MCRLAPVDGARNDAHRQPIAKRRPFEHLDVIRIPTAVVGKIDPVAAPAAGQRQIDNRPPEVRDVPDVFNRRLAIDQNRFKAARAKRAAFEAVCFKKST